MKADRGQFYTVNSSYILDTFQKPEASVQCIEPFAGKGDLLDWLGERQVECYDIEPQKACIVTRDTLLDPPTYTNKWILTNPPYLARNKIEDKTYFDLYGVNDLYKCFMMSLLSQKPCLGGIFIIPVGFFVSSDKKCRDAFMCQYRITAVRYFEEDVFPDTSTTVVAFSFEKSDTPLTSQDVEWTLLPQGKRKTFHLSRENDWIIGGDIYKLRNPSDFKIRRYVVGMTLRENEHITHLLLSALDSGKRDGRIRIEYKEGYVYPAKKSSRTFATLCIQGKTLTKEEQIELALQFNTLLECKRDETWSLFLPQFRESKEYARKRIPFELVYKVVLSML